MTMRGPAVSGVAEGGVEGDSYQGVRGSVLLNASEVVKTFGEDRALRGVSLAVSAGEVVAVVGPSGCGKSTLLHCLAGVLMPDRGEVSYKGAALKAMTAGQLSSLRSTQFGFVFQFGQLVPELRAVDNVALPLMLAGVPRRSALARAAGALDRLSVGQLAARRPGQMSGGQAQRVAIARALVGEPAVVFADEPTGSLDSETGSAAMSLFLEVVRERRAALVLVTHDASVAAQADRVIAMRDGQVEAG